MKLTDTLLAIFAVFMLVVAIYYSPKHGTKVYDCSIAEISLDYPEDVKQECRKLIGKKLT